MRKDKKIIYLDNNSTTRVDSAVLEAMIPFLTEDYGNAASSHLLGASVSKSIKEAREYIASLIGSDIHEIIFTSGATESINLALKGVAEKNEGSRRHIITLQTEHPAVLDTCAYLESKGYKLTYLPVGTDGLLSLDSLKAEISNETLLVCAMWVNNETGVIQPIQDIARIAHENGSYFMTDATQAVGKLPVNVDTSGIDIMAFSAHKFYGPKGVGGLYFRSKRPNKVRMLPILHGGGHEGGLRSGTLNVPGIIGMGKAAEICMKVMKADTDRILKLRDTLETELLKLEDTGLNGSPGKRLYNTTNICFRGADADAVIIDLQNIMVSNGSACSSAKVEPSHVLTAMGLNSIDSYSSLRISLGRFTTAHDIDIAIKAISEVVTNIRQIK